MVPSGHVTRITCVATSRTFMTRYLVFHRPTLPVTAVSRIGGQTFAFVVADNKGQTIAQQRTVQLGEIVGNSYTVLGGINPGDKVIVSSVNMLVDGMPIVPETASQKAATPSAAGPQS